MIQADAALDTASEEFLEGPLLERVIPLAEAQAEVWLADRLSTEASLAFNEAIELRLRGALDVPALRGALDAVIARHDALRATVGPDGSELLVALPAPLDLVQHDLRGLPPDAAEAVLQRAREAAVTTPFALERGPLLRVSLHRIADAEHALLLTAHHIVCDGWSWGVIVEDLGALYAEQLGEAPAPEPAPSYSEYVAWERREAAGDAMREHEAWWVQRYAGGAPAALELSTDRPRPLRRAFDSRRIDRVLPASLLAAVRTAGARHGASLFGTLFTGFAATLSRLTGQDDLVVGVPAAGQSASGMTGLVGHCVNFLPVRVAVDAQQPLGALLKQTASGLLDAFDHQTLTFGTLLRKLALPRDPSRLPLVSVMFNLDQAIRDRDDLFPGLHVALAGQPRAYENFELFCNAVQVGDTLRLEVQYATTLFDAASVGRWLDAYEAMLCALVDDAGRALAAVPIVGAAGLAELRALQPAPTPVAADDRMHSAFVRQAAATPTRIALSQGDVRLTYAELDRRSNRLAHRLRALGAARGARIGLSLPRGPEMLVALLGVLKTGAAYVPLDPAFPPARLAYYAEDAALELLVTASSVAAAPRAWRADAAERIVDLDRDGLEDGDDGALAGMASEPDDAAYVIYTSGSTGKPKGVAVPHRAVVNFLASMAVEPGISPDDRLAAVTTLSFDIAVLELLLPLAVGAEVVLVHRETAMDGALLAELLAARGATAMQATPGLWRNLVEAGWSGAPGFRAFVGGEALPRDLADDLLDRCAQVWNLYGPTETTVWSTCWRVDRAGLGRGVSIGRPVANTEVWIVDAAGEPLPVGVPGEIGIGGAGVALGYLGRPELTVERFVAAPAALGGGRMYRTGDRGRFRNDGLLEHLGRNDFQVKVRGYRIELGEIESACVAHAGVGDAVVVAREERAGDVRLVAYLVAAAGSIGSIDKNALRTHLAARLPEYMLPQHVVVLPALPRLPNGKIDRKALPAPQAEPAAERGRAARDDTERAVLAAFEGVLSLPGLGVDEDFFALGGHSLLAARLTARLNREFAIRLPLRTVFEARSAEAMAAAVAEARAAQRVQRAPIVADPARRHAPLTPQQQRIVFVEAMHPGRVVYNTPSAHRLRGPFDRRAFEAAFAEVVRRQGALRTRIGNDADGRDVQEVLPAVAIELPMEDLSGVPAAGREAELMRRVQAIVDRPIDIRTAPLWRAALWRLADDEHAFLFMPHHLVWDGWSFDLLYEEMASIYGALAERRAPALAPPPVSYADYAAWQAEWLQGAEAAQQAAWWKERYARQVPPAALRPDHERRAGMSGEGASVWVHVDRPITERLRVAARRADATLNMLALAAYAAMLSAVTGGQTVLVGVPVRGRGMAEVEPVMGFFNNLLPLHVPVPRAQPFDAWVGEVKALLLDAFGQQDLPFERLAEDPQIAAATKGTGLYQALFSFQDARDRTRQWGGLTQSSILVFQKGATEDLGLWLMEVPGGLEGGFTYNADLYTERTATEFRTRYLELLQRIGDAPSPPLGELLGVEASPAGQALLRLRAAAAPAAAAPRAAPAVALQANERALARIWAALLGIDESQLRADDNFFDVGGSSLLAMRAIEASAAELGFRVDPQRYVAETIAQLAVAPADPVPADEPRRSGLLGRLIGGLAGRR